MHSALRRSSFYSDDPATATFIFVPFYSGLWTLLCLYSRSLFQDQITLQRAFQRERTSCLTLSDLADEVTQSSFWAQSKGKNFIWISNHVNVRPIPNPSILMTVEKSQEVGNVQLSLVLPYSIIEPADIGKDENCYFRPNADRNFHGISRGIK